jgi:hypothetical protein
MHLPGGDAREEVWRIMKYAAILECGTGPFAGEARSTLEGLANLTAAAIIEERSARVGAAGDRANSSTGSAESSSVCAISTGGRELAPADLNRLLEGTLALAGLNMRHAPIEGTLDEPNVGEFSYIPKTTSPEAVLERVAVAIR